MREADIEREELGVAAYECNTQTSQSGGDLLDNPWDKERQGTTNIDTGREDQRRNRLGERKVMSLMMTKRGRNEQKREREK
jgi:hypothetical protein